jgi:hypothetical protein
VEESNGTSTQPINRVENNETLNSDRLGPIVSDEEFECSILNYTALGRVILPGCEIYAPVEASTIKIKDNSVNVSEVKVIGTTPGEKLGEDQNEVELEYKLTFQLQFFDKDLNIVKIKRENSNYPLPNDEVIIKDYLAAAMIFRRKVIINGRADTAVAEACLVDIHGQYIEEKKYISFYDINNEPYHKINITIKLYTYINADVIFNDCASSDHDFKPKTALIGSIINKYRALPKSKRILTSIFALIIISKLTNCESEDNQ